jgi:hypothetical protein
LVIPEQPPPLPEPLEELVWDELELDEAEEELRRDEELEGLNEDDELDRDDDELREDDELELPATTVKNHKA